MTGATAQHVSRPAPGPARAAPPWRPLAHALV